MSIIRGQGPRAATKGFGAVKNVFALREFLGHASLDTAALYVQVFDEELDAMVGAATLGRFPTIRHIAGLPADEGPDLDARSAFLAEFTNLAGRARQLGLELTLR